MPDAYRQDPAAPRGDDGAALPLGPQRTLVIRYTDGCIIHGMMGPDGPQGPLLVEAGTEAIIDIPVPIRLVLGVASPEEQERYRGQ